MAKSTPKQSRARTSKGAPAKAGQDNVYRELLSDAVASGDLTRNERPLKKRKVTSNSTNGGQSSAATTSVQQDIPVADQSAESTIHGPDPSEQIDTPLDGNEEDGYKEESHTPRDNSPSLLPGHPQTVYDDSESSEESDIDWENALNAQASTEPSAPPQHANQNLRIDLQEEQSKQKSKRHVSQRLLSTHVEKRKRLAIHKMHICTLLALLYIRNDRCNDQRIHNILQPVLDRRTKAFLKPRASLSQHDRTKQLLKGLEEASHAWRSKFVITSRGTRKPEWPTSAEEIESRLDQTDDTPDDYEHFASAAAKPSGSRDLGVQLFCALLRSVGVDARLVCSLQLLSFTSVAPAIIPPPPSKTTVDLTSSALNADTDSEFEADTPAREQSPTLRPVRRFGRAPAGSESIPDLGKAPPSASKRRKIVDSSYPVYWVEAFNNAKQQWMPVDPFATRTVNKPAKLEPPASDPLNDMTYVMAFSEDGTIKDVTRRYAKAYNAKTRRSRVEATDGDDRWLRHALKVFTASGGKDDRDAIEDAELDNIEAKEPMPRNVQDFKGHPYYALERHLRRHEVLHPKRQAGKLRVGKGHEAVEPVYRRRDVQTCKTADKWYRLGRELKSGEQPIKRAKQTRRRAASMTPDASEDEHGNETVGLYTIDQTDLYVPPPCTNGKVPKNHFKNLDVYVPSMIPPGAVHIRSSDGVAAAKILRIDFAEAVTGFTFRGRRGTAVMRGVIIVREYREAMEEVVEALRYQRRVDDQAKRTRLALSMWKKFMLGLRIRERIMSQTPSKAELEADSDDSVSEYEDDAEDLDGGFMIEESAPVARPTRGKDVDVLKEKFQDHFAEVINDDPTKRSKEYWESTVVSPWDVPGLLKPHTPEPAPPPIEELFEEPQEAGGFVREDSAEVLPQMRTPDRFDTEDDEQVLTRAQHVGEADEVVPKGELATPPVESSQLEANMGRAGNVEDPSRVHNQKSPSPSYNLKEREDSEADEESLLSEDPEDADAEPEWLVDGVGF